MKNILQKATRKATISEINKKAEKNFLDFIDECELQYNLKLQKLCDEITLFGGEKKLLFIAGPSSSGKTTTAKKIKSMIDKKGIDNCVIGMDDFYLDRECVPLREDGSKDLEGPSSIDIKSMIFSIKQLIEKGSSKMPVFDFATGKPSKATKDISVSLNGVIIIEGLNALNPAITEQFKKIENVKVYKVGIFTDTIFMNGEDEYISPSENRLTRRIIRDFKFRATEPSRTLDMWKYVAQGEKDYINPYIDSADCIIGTTLLYEPCLYAEYLNKMANNEKNVDVKTQLLALYEVYKVFSAPKQAIEIPKDSIIKEFLG